MQLGARSEERSSVYSGIERSGWWAQRLYRTEVGLIIRPLWAKAAASRCVVRRYHK
jgi:hypothetical protein